MQLSRVLVAVTGSIALAACYHGGGDSGGGAVENRTAKPLALAASSDVLAFLPMDSEIVLGLDARQIVASPLWKHAGPQLMARIAKGVGDFQATCGYDPIAALQSVTVGLKATTPIDGVFVLRGLPRDKTLACAGRAIPRQPPIVVEGGIITVPGDGPDDPPAVMTFADATTLVVATSRGKLDAALASGAPLRRSRAFSELWALVDAKRAVWAILNGSSRAFSSLASFGVRPRAMFGSIALTNGLSLSGRLRLGTADEATQLASLGQSQVGPMQTMVDKVEIGADGVDVTLRVDMTAAQLDMLAGMATSMLRP